MLLLKNALINDAVNPLPYKGDILIDGSKIKQISSGIHCSGVHQEINLEGLSVYPGFIEAHCHLGLHGYGIGFEGQDYNEKNDIITPELRAVDSINPQDPTFAFAAKAGITCVCAGPGSTNVLGGTFSVLKTVGNCVDKMIVIRNAAMKCAFGENPKVYYKEKCNYTRMSTASKLREMLYKAKEYKDALDGFSNGINPKPIFDMKLNALVPVVERRMPLKAHAHRADDICTAIRIAKEFDVLLTLEHCTEGHLIVDVISECGYPVAVGPTLTHASKFELKNKSWETAGILSKAGCQVSIITDSPVTPEEYLPICAGYAVKHGMDPFEALKAITINPAKHIGVSDRLGSLEVGKDADVVVTDGDPLVSNTNIEMTIINGSVVYSRH